jgi:hypothetical protein
LVCVGLTIGFDRLAKTGYAWNVDFADCPYFADGSKLVGTDTLQD